MQVKCSSCGASQIVNQNNLCLYCGTTISSDLKSTADEISQIELALFEYKKGNFSKSSIQFDEILKHQPSVFIAWAYKIFSDFQTVFPSSLRTDYPNPSSLRIDFDSFNNEIEFIIKKATDISKKKILEDILIDMLHSLLNRKYILKDVIEKSFLSYIGIYNSDNRRNFLNIYNIFSINLSDEFSKSIINELINFYRTNGKNSRPFEEDVLKLDDIILIIPILSRNITLSENFIMTILDVSSEYWKKRLKREAHFMRDELPSSDDFKKGEILIQSLIESNPKLNFNQLLIPFKENCNIISNELKTLKSNETKDSKKSQNEKSCFIATAAMGAYDHPVVLDLRLFRDNWLLKRQWGIDFTNWYYTNGPKAAKLIEKSKFLRKITFVFIVKPLQILTKKLR
jgi:hypothetical protein